MTMANSKDLIAEARRRGDPLSDTSLYCQLADALETSQKALERAYRAMNETSGQHPGYKSILADMREVLEGQG